MVFNNIVVAYDGSDHAVDAVMKARDFALADPEVRIHVVFVTTHPNAQLPASFNNSSFDPEQYLLSVEDVMDLYNRTIAEESEKVKAGLGVASRVLKIKSRSMSFLAIRQQTISSSLQRRSKPILS